MLWVGGPFFRQIFIALGGLAVLVLAGPSAGQQQPGQAAPPPGLGAGAAKTYASTGQLTVQVQETTGAPFFEGAMVTLFTSDVAERFSSKSDEGGRTKFTALPVGQYLVEIVAPGYRTVQQQVRISGTQEMRDIVVSMVPKTSDGKGKGKTSVSAKALKEADKALRSLQLNNLDDAELHLKQSLDIDLNFADANYLMGVLLLRQKDAGRAAAYLQKTLSISPNYVSAMIALGEAQYLNHDYDHAGASFEKFLHDFPNSPQVPIAQKYVNAIYKLRLANAAATGGPSSSTGSDLSSNAVTESAETTALPDVTNVTEVNWAPPDVDEEEVELTATDGCSLDSVVHAAGNRIRELVENVDHFTATENIEHSSVTAMGLKATQEKREFNYLVEIHPVGGKELNVEEYRKGFGVKRDFPEGIETVGLPSLALIFHPYLRERYDFQCEGRGSWRGKAAWVVHFQQKTDQKKGMLTYHVGQRFIEVGLKGRAWVDADTSQIVAMESDIMKPIPEIRLLRDHQLVEYGPVSFRNNSLQLWLPKSADWYCAISGKRFHRRHAFSQFLLFSVDDKQKIGEPKVPVDSGPQQ